VGSWRSTDPAKVKRWEAWRSRRVWVLISGEAGEGDLLWFAMVGMDVK